MVGVLVQIHGSVCGIDLNQATVPPFIAIHSKELVWWLVLVLSWDLLTIRKITTHTSYKEDDITVDLLTGLIH